MTAVPMPLEVREQIARALETEAEARGWDQPHQLLHIYGTTLGETNDGGLAVGLEFEGLTIPDGLHPCMFLAATATAVEMAAKLGAPPPPRHVGYALVTESWGVTVEDGQSRSDYAPRFEDDPRRQESRQVMVVDHTGESTTVTRRRGGDPTVIANTSGRLLDAPVHLGRTHGALR